MARSSLFPPRKIFPPPERAEEEETTEFPFGDEPSQVDSLAVPPASAAAVVTVEEETHHEEGKRSFSEDEYEDKESIVAVEHDGQLVGKDEEGDPAAYESSTVGSTSKSSGEWSSANLRNSETDHHFSSSSRRHSSKWESYALFRKYDEEMTFFDQLSAQKLSDADSLRMVRTQRKSIPERIVHKLTAREKQTGSFRVAHRELEAAYVGQICLTWEALSWNYKLLRQAIAGEQGGGGFSARTAQQFQQFQVFLQRFVENEPYEDGRRPEVYARRRITAPKLLQVPELHDWYDRNGEGDEDSMISTVEFLAILEDCIGVFMEFLNGDKESRWSAVRALLRSRPSSGGASLLLHVLRKVNDKKRRRLEDLLRRGSCLVMSRRRRRRRREEEMEVLMGLVDMKIVSRVLRMRNVSEEQLRWCQEKMSKVKVCEGKIQRDSSPLFFPLS